MARSADAMSTPGSSLPSIARDTEWRAEARRFRDARDRGCPTRLPNDPVMTSRVAITRMTLGLALVHRPTDAERDRGQKLLAEVSEEFVRREYLLCRFTDHQCLPGA